MKAIELYQTANGRIPFSEWFLTLDEVVQQKIDAYIDRMARGGSQGNIKSVGKGLYELKIDYGPGYRVYFGELDRQTILLLLGGSKRTQSRDIGKAIEYWEDYETNH